VSYELFLDDERYPTNQSALIVRSFKEFKQIIEDFGWPNHICFDHDLGKNQPTGLDVAKWIIEQDMDHNILPKDFTFSVHSMNPIGATNIKNLLQNYIAFKNEKSV
jgi:hypothetical protein